ncbi:MAG TPA: type II toxin-antitoxin system VapC family toxin [Acidisoma sp.]|uniref:type II toxin-antitoxin system VapC family toxin n=1 Tax=Acidisoma sp. TaxID=1872115 RepID=UPI002CCE70EF|nr:type II toxin-antitoxin system VapC family toxin [Acidisoma sp.]HTI02400.1 type II toxin-antitoxin system VapC family toxin [Acidisoma sp.]
MILLDTNVLSALMLTEPDPVVVRWLDRLDPALVWTTSVNVFEIRYGLARRVDGRKTRQLEEAFDALIREDLEGRVAPLDHAAAEAAGILTARRTAAGRSVDFRDTLIAGIAIANKATLATGNVRHFVGLEIRVSDPWRDTAG